MQSFETDWFIRSPIPAIAPLIPAPTIPDVVTSAPEIAPPIMPVAAATPPMLCPAVMACAAPPTPPSTPPAIAPPATHTHCPEGLSVAASYTKALQRRFIKACGRTSLYQAPLPPYAQKQLSRSRTRQTLAPIASNRTRGSSGFSRQAAWSPRADVSVHR